jgi:hypothetical protein
MFSSADCVAFGFSRLAAATREFKLEFMMTLEIGAGYELLFVPEETLFLLLQQSTVLKWSLEITISL